MQSQTDSVMFPTLVKDALRKISHTPAGKNLLTGITQLAGHKKFGYTVCIMRADMTYDPGCATGWRGTNVAIRGDENAATHGGHSVTAIKYNANMIQCPDGARPS